MSLIPRTGRATKTLTFLPVGVQGDAPKGGPYAGSTLPSSSALGSFPGGRKNVPFRAQPAHPRGMALGARSQETQAATACEDPHGQAGTGGPIYQEAAGVSMASRQGNE